ncbi:MAG: beta-ketoacyl-[acyl-carrier-protein] synthase family protein [Betaproteobacteria bacterium]|nr:beta-ketoacyl-[acyl-carrier-protein] synthase family protein [Betaproteobacteria bacterium]
MREVCITGIGVVAPIGVGYAAFQEGLRAGRSGIRALPRADESAPLRVAGVVDIAFADHLAAPSIPGLDRVCLLARVAANQAIADAAVADSSQWSAAGVYVGTGIGGVSSLEAGYEEFFVRGGARIKPLTVVQAMNNAAAAHIALEHRCHGPVLTYSVACSSSAVAIGEAYRAIRHGYVDCAIAGGAEALLTPGTIRSWEALRTLALPDAADPAASCKPFSKNRTGLVLAEGAGMVVLESVEHAKARGARIHAMLAGYGCRTDATHMTKPDADGQTATMLAALADAGLAAEAIDYINAHGTSTLACDIAETNAVKRVFGKRAENVPVSSSKSMHGHCMGATGAIEFIAALAALDGGFLPPTINLSQPDPECDLDYVPNRAREGVTLGNVMSNSFAFGGSNAVLIASRHDA